MKIVKKVGTLVAMSLIVFVIFTGFFSLGKTEVAYDVLMEALKEEQVISVKMTEKTSILSDVTYKDKKEKKYIVDSVVTEKFVTDMQPYRKDVEFITKKGMTPAEMMIISIMVSSCIYYVVNRVLFLKEMRKQRNLNNSENSINNYEMKESMTPQQVMDTVGRQVESQTKLKDVAGCDEEKLEVMEIIDFLKNPKKYTDMGATIPKGILLVGPPGTGKTLLAKAIAGEAGVTFIHASGSEFIEKFVGVGAKRVRTLFEEAKKTAPAILFIDEIDAIGRQRSNGEGNQEHEQTLNQFLVELDGMEENNGVIVLGATNRPEILDRAFLRKGRFDRKVTIGLPDTTSRYEILKVHAAKKRLSNDIDLHDVAQKTHGFSGADLYAVLNEAALMAVRNNHKAIMPEDIDEGIDRVMMGHSSKSRKYGELEKKMVAYHESGHVVMGLKLSEADKVDKVTIVPRGDAGGYAMLSPREERFLLTKETLIEKICGLLGGRCAEEIKFGKVTTGASNDLERATRIARRMVTQYGMSRLGLTHWEGEDSSYSGFTQVSGQYSTVTSNRIDAEVEYIIADCYKRTKEILMKNLELLDALANQLIEKETLNHDEIMEMEEKYAG